MTALSLNDTLASPGAPSSDGVPRSIGRLLDVFEAVVEHNPCTLSEVAEVVGLTPTTARRYLQALAVRRYVERDPDGLYQAGPAARAAAERLRGEDELATLARRAQPHLHSLAGVAGESAYLGVRDHDAIVYLAMAQSERAIRHVGWIGQRLPVDSTAIGAALRSPDGPVFRSGGLEPDIAAVSMSLPGEWRARAAISIVGPAHRFDEAAIEVFRHRLRTAVDAMARDLDLPGSEHAP